MFDLSKMAKNHWGLMVVFLIFAVIFFSFGRGCRGGGEQIMTKDEVVAIVKNEIAVMQKPTATEGENKVIVKELPREKTVLVPSLPKIVPKTIVVPVPRFASPAPPAPFVFSSLDEAKIRVFDDGQNKIRILFAKKQEKDLATRKREIEQYCCSTVIIWHHREVAFDKKPEGNLVDKKGEKKRVFVDHLPSQVVGSAVTKIKPGREKEFAQEMEKHRKVLEVERLAFENKLHLQREFYLQQLRYASQRLVMYR